MAEKNDRTEAEPQQQTQLQGGTYEVIRNRLEGCAKDLRSRLTKLNAARKDVFGAIETKLTASERISTENNCVPRDMVPLENIFLFGYNVFVGLRTETKISDVFSIYKWNKDGFSQQPLDIIDDERFRADFFNLYKYYRHAVFAKFAVIGPHLFMVFNIGKSVSDIKTFKWLIQGDNLQYLDNRSDHEYVFPPQHEFEWTRATQDMHRSGLNPHISIEDRVFVETVGGDLTVKIEDNTESGEGIYSEPVDDPDQTLNDAEIYYAIIGNIIILRIRPYQEQNFRYLVFNEKTQSVVRVDSIKDACVLLPEYHGIVFPRGYYLKTGEQKQFDTDMNDMVFEKRISSPNGEDYLFVFYNRDSGVYVLLSYNIIEQKMAVPVVCSGYSMFEDGTMIYFRSDNQPQKHHVIQIWQTPYCGPDHTFEIRKDSELYKIGNKSIVRCMAECMELIILIGKEESYANLYVDISKKAEDILDTYFWLKDEDAFYPAEPVSQIKDAAAAAIEEYEKVVRTKQNTRRQIEEVGKNVNEIIDAVDYGSLTEIDQYVGHLTELRSVRGKVVSLKDLRYADLELVEKLEATVAEHNEKLSELCVEFLLRPESLAPYGKSVKQLADKISAVEKVAQAKELQQEVGKVSDELEMLTEIVSNLKIEDATETVSIIDNISLVYSEVNKVKAAIKNKINALGAIEGKAEFGSQIKLVDQSVINYMDVCDTPEKCDEYLTKVTVQLETLEGRFADFEEFIVELAEKREEVYNAFESRKLSLIAERNQRASALMAAAERILKGIENRVRSFKQVNEINGYFASDLMIERVRETIGQLETLGDSVKAEDVKTQLKTLQQDSIRQLKDRQALYEDSDNIIRFGDHRFSVNQQTIEGTIVQRNGKMLYHLAGTGFFEEIAGTELLSDEAIRSLQVVSESGNVYRAEYLAYLMFGQLQNEDRNAVLNETHAQTVKRVQAFMGPRFDEGYIKGVHDSDAAKILNALLKLRSEIGLLRYPAKARAMAAVFWQMFFDEQLKQQLRAKIAGVGRIRKLFGADGIENSYIMQIENLMSKFVQEHRLFDESLVSDAAEYLFHQLTTGDKFAASKTAMDIKRSLEIHLENKEDAEEFNRALDSIKTDPIGSYGLLRDMVSSYIRQLSDAKFIDYADETASIIFEQNDEGRQVIDKGIDIKIEKMNGTHFLVTDGVYELNYCDFITRLGKHHDCIVPKFRSYQKTKKQLVEKYADELRLDEFRPRVLTTFVRNKLIDKVYLPLLGDNLAKQIGTADDGKRTDYQGLLMLISPPGYGKTTLMEYVANRLGLIFMKINGPYIGHGVTSFDPAEASNAAARQELTKLNLAFEMGDNVMIYLDDIQHTNPEFLQKFISLCDAQRRVDGVYKGKSRTYDLRGKRVCVVMAGNPYTESGEKFRIPDMLSNRADTYNIGDIVGDNYTQFVTSYIENCLTSNPVLEKLANRSQSDVYSIIKLAETDRKDGLNFESSYSVDELNEYVSTMKKLFVVRDVVLKVNQQYIGSAAQADEYRTEPRFLLQGSYRNMNRIASRVLPVMNEQELWTLIYSSYEQDAQTLTTGAESNLLKFRELTSRLSEQQSKRWEDIKKTFNRNQLLGSGSDDKVSRIIQQLNAFSAGLDSIQTAISDGVNTVASLQTQPTVKEPEKDDREDANILQQVGGEVLAKMSELINSIKQQDQAQNQKIDTQLAVNDKKNSEMLVSVLEEQFRTMETWLIPVHHGDADRQEYFEHLVSRFRQMVDGYGRLINALENKYKSPDTPKSASLKNAANVKKVSQKTKSKTKNSRPDKG